MVSPTDFLGRDVVESLHRHSTVPLPLGKGGMRLCVGYGIYDVPIEKVISKR